MNEPFAGWSEDDASGHAHREPTTDFIFPDDEGDEKQSQHGSEQAEFVAKFITKLHPRTSLNQRGERIVKRLAGASLLLQKHLGFFRGRSIRQLATDYKLTPAFLYALNAEIYGQGFGVSPRSERGRENMREARLRCLQKALPLAHPAEGPKKEGSCHTSKEGASQQGGAR